jgi:cAMP-dependent protein kinase regulator
MSGQEEHSRYIQRVVNPVLENLVTEIITNKPQDILLFMHNWLTERHPSTKMSSAQHEELHNLRRNLDRLKKKQVDSASESEDSGGDFLEELPVRTVRGSQARYSVSAEAFGQWNKKEDFVPRVIRKTAEQRAQIIERLSRSFIFSALEESERDVVIDAMEERNAEAGDAIINQGEDGEELFVVDSGRLACSKVLKEGQPPTFLKNYEAGDAFGELALLYNAPRAASIKAETPSKLWVLDRATFNHIVKDSAVRKRERYEDLLSRVELLENMDAYERSQVADAFKPAVFAKGEYVIREGDWGELFYIIDSGSAVATKTLTPGKPPSQVKTYSVGSYFGELALLRGEPRAANIIADSNLKCVTLDRQSFKRMLGPLEEILRRNAAKYEGYLLSS